MKTHSITLAGSGEGLLRRQLVQHESHGIERERDRCGDLHHDLLAMVIDHAAEPDADEGRGHQEHAGHHARCQHGLGLQEHPERDREPEGEVDDRNQQRVDQQVHKGAISAPAEVEHARLGRRHLADSPVVVPGITD
jgi:hypothetical protein